MIFLHEYITKWLKHREQLVELDTLAKSTFDNQYRIAGVITGMCGTIATSDFRKSSIELFIAKRGLICKPVTVAGELDVLRQILNWIVDEGYEFTMPRFPQLSVPTDDSPFPDDEDFIFVLTHSQPKASASLEFMLLTGLAPHENGRLQVRDYDATREKYGSIGIGQRPDFKVKRASRRRWVPLGYKASALWAKWTFGMEPREHPFHSPDAARKAMQRLRESVPGTPPEITPKMMRKWFSSHLAGNNVPEHVLQALLGHAPGSKITRQHYVRSNNADRVAATTELEIG